MARTQTSGVASRLRAMYPGLEVEEIVIKTRGDEILDQPLHQVGGKGLFVKEIEEALLDGRIDVAVHSLKDLPSLLPEGLTIGAVPEREAPWDVLVSRGGESIRGLAPGSRVGTSSLRRRAQLRRYRKDLELVDIRGNVDTRLRKVREGEVDAAVVAAAGLIRMGLEEEINERLAPEVVLPAVGQGALGIEARADDRETLSLLAGMEHPPTRFAVEAEREVMYRLEGGCKVPLAAFAEMRKGTLLVRALVASLDGDRIVEGAEEGPPEDAVRLGGILADRLLESGAAEILEEIQRV